MDGTEFFATGGGAARDVDEGFEDLGVVDAIGFDGAVEGRLEIRVQLGKDRDVEGAVVKDDVVGWVGEPAGEDSDGFGGAANEHPVLGANGGDDEFVAAERVVAGAALGVRDFGGEAGGFRVDGEEGEGEGGEGVFVTIH